MTWPRSLGAGSAVVVGIAIGSLVAAGCGGEGCPPDTTRVGDRCVAADGGVPDGGSDAGPCGGCDSGMVCDTEADPPACVQCLGDDDCSGDTPVCDTDANECVGCTQDTDCTDPTASTCDTTDGECVPCTDPDGCTHLDTEEAGNLGVCDEGTCVECTPATQEEECGAKSCDPVDLECGPHDRGSRRPCESCVSDDDCENPATHHCVPMQYMGADRDSGYCLKEAGSCERPFSIALEDRTSLSGTTADYCGINEMLATCEAVRALLDDAMCPGGMDSECPQPGGICRTVGTLANRCTYECGLAVHCPSDAPADTCGTGDGDAGVTYCGG